MKGRILVHLTSLTLYPTPRCQLDCVFCPLTKMPYLSEMDKQFEKSYEDTNYYVRQLLNLGIDNIKDIHRIEFWGGEPTLELHRTFNVVREFIGLLPKLDSFYFSTNFAYSKVDEEIEGLVDVLGGFPDRKFTIRIQLSIDGPEEITDYSRGKGVTKKFMDNYHKLMDKQWFSDKYPNVFVETVYKPTLDTTSVKKFLDIDYIYHYYHWFEEALYDEAMEHKSSKYKPMIRAIPNLATPIEASMEDGLIFAEAERNALRLSIKNPFKYYNSVVMYTRNKKYSNINRVLYCGVGRGIVELLPLDKYCACHRAFLTYCDDYRNAICEPDVAKKVIDGRGLSSESPVFIYDNAKDFIDFCGRVGNMTTASSAFVTSQSTIRYLAKLNQIDNKYIDADEAFRAANLMSEYVSQCMYDNYTVCGTQMTSTFGAYRMFLNGAIDVIKVATERMCSNAEAKSI